MDRWFPVARSAEVVPRHVAQTQLLGQEIALWRADTGVINAWENRCPHRGVRLSIGHNTGTEVRCRYHGWRFAGGSGQCTFIPAHPTQKPAGSIRVRAYAAIERYHLVWVNLDPHTDFPELQLTETARDATLRSIFINAPIAAVRNTLSRGYRIDATAEGSVTVADAFTLTAALDSGRAEANRGDGPNVVFFLQPVTETQTLLHGLLQAAPSPVERLETLRHHNTQMSALRNEAERLYAAGGIPARSPQRAPC